MIARDAATLDEISNCRVSLGLCSGGSLTLKPLCISMWDRPIDTLKETNEVVRSLIRGESVSYDGKTLHLKQAGFSFETARKEIPIILVGRGPQILNIAGMMADGHLFGSVPNSYLDYGIRQIMKSAKRAGRDPKMIKIKGSISFSNAAKEEFEEFLRWRVANVVSDTPDYVFAQSNIESEVSKTVRSIKQCKNLNAIKLVTTDLTKLYPFVNTPESCIKEAKNLVKKGINSISLTVPPGQEDVAFPIIRKEIIGELKSL